MYNGIFLIYTEYHQKWATMASFTFNTAFHRKMGYNGIFLICTLMTIKEKSCRDKNSGQTKNTAQMN
jgi:hypothetical protein